ncbi:uncharacterized protein H6S33_004899 [Morchella sextelata]|uniref:uncharacterized protein n=1 Tax=Morchella sextelata TaxID=1174677 RepID=UPI001D051D55|nr:uncharacterized protein H6S33_004899 [Morchella sextelata]KAH0605677.1 hypothetical protein H6S33_004899 [Morchella sextelata]
MAPRITTSDKDIHLESSVYNLTRIPRSNISALLSFVSSVRSVVDDMLGNIKAMLICFTVRFQDFNDG